MFSCFSFAVSNLNRYDTKDPGRGGPCLDQIGPGPRPRLEDGPLCSLLFFSLIFLMLFCFPGYFGDVVSRFQQLRQRTPCGGYRAGGEGGVSGPNFPEK